MRYINIYLLLLTGRNAVIPPLVESGARPDPGPAALRSRPSVLWKNEGLGPRVS